IPTAHLLENARRVAASLLERGSAGERVFIALPPGAPFFEVFLGCQLAGMLPVAVPPGGLRRRAETLEAMVALTQPLVMVCESVPANASAPLPLVAADELLATDRQKASTPAATDLAYLQFTSGSTGKPRAVMISHEAVCANVDGLADKARLSEASKVLSWLPVHHDMGLVSSIFALVSGHDLILERPETFSRAPLGWLEAISRHGAHFSGAPNFAYEILGRAPLERETAHALDLSTWEIAFCGAEPIRPAALQRFALTFAEAGFAEAALCPAYGMAEFTLQATSAGRGMAMQARALNAAQGARDVMSVGSVVSGHRLAIVDPETRLPLADGQTGEIWLAGASMGQGYWKDAQATAATFNATLAGQDRPHWLRTGDLGQLIDGELYVLGRIKNVLVHQGRNFHAEEIETVAAAAHPLLTLGNVAAYPVMSADGGEALGLICELPKAKQTGIAEYEALVAALQSDLARHLGLDAQRITMIRRLALPRTTSGKLRRAHAAELLEEGALPVLFDWEKPPLARTAEPLAAEPTRADIEDWLVAWMHVQLGRAAGHGMLRASLADLGLHSIAAVELAHDLEDWLKRPIRPMQIFEAASLDALAQALAGPAAGAPLQTQMKAKPDPASPKLIDDSFEARLAELETLSDYEVDLRLAQNTSK
ncbi:MAG: non-ribosomal peptide synthetase, partial [Pseudomonadota bacterium]